MNYLKIAAACVIAVWICSCASVKQNGTVTDAKTPPPAEISKTEPPALIPSQINQSPADSPAHITIESSQISKETTITVNDPKIQIDDKKDSTPAENKAAEQSALSEQNPAAEEQTIEQQQPKISYTLKIISRSDIPTAGKKFTKPYTVQVISDADSKPAASIDVQFSYPAVRSENGYEFSSSVLRTDESGTVSFLPPVPPFACSTEAVFKVIEVKNDGTEGEVLASVSVPYKVKTARTSSGGSIALVDFDKTGKPVINNSFSSSAVLTTLIRSGFSNIGNSDFTQQIVSGSDAAVYKAAKQLFGNNTYFMLYGTVKYDGAPEKTEKGFIVRLTADVVCRDMISNTVIFKQTVSASGEGSAEYEALNNARRLSLAEQIAELIRYSL